MCAFAVRLASLVVAVLLVPPVTGQPAGAAREPTAQGTPTIPVPEPTAAAERNTALDAVADDYVRLVLAAGRHDPQFVDGYCGPAAWQVEAAQGQPVPLPELRTRSRALLARLPTLPASPRRTFLEKQLAAVEGFLLRLSGQPMSLQEEARALFDIDPAAVPREELEHAREKLDEAVAGERSLQFRVDVLRKALRVPRDRLPAVMDAALALLRRRTAALVALPAGEQVRLAYVTGRPWRGHATYQGNFTTLIEIDTDTPMELADVLQVAAREGYPGHHVFNVLVDEKLARAKGWREYTVHPLDSPESVIAEGAAAVALDVVMDRAAQRTFMRDVLAPLAGVRSSDLDEDLDFREAARSLRRTDDVAVRMLLDEGRPDSEVEEYLVRFALRSTAQAKGALEYYRAYRSYVLARSAGEDLVAGRIGKGPDRAARFLDLFQQPIVVPSELVSQH